MATHSRLHIAHLDKKLAQFFIATIVNPEPFGEIRTQADLAHLLGVARSTVNQWVSGKETTGAHAVPAEHVTTLANCLVKLQPNKITLEQANYLWCHAPYPLFAAHIIGRPMSRLGELLDKTSPTLELTARVVNNQKGLITNGPATERCQHPDFTVPIGKPFTIESVDDVTGWPILLGQSRNDIQMLVPSQRDAMEYIRRAQFRYPKLGTYPRLNAANEIYSFTLIIAQQSNAPPPVLMQRAITLPLNATEELSLVNALTGVAITWGVMTVLASQ